MLLVKCLNVAVVETFLTPRTIYIEKCSQNNSRRFSMLHLWRLSSSWLGKSPSPYSSLSNAIIFIQLLWWTLSFLVAVRHFGRWYSRSVLFIKRGSRGLDGFETIHHLTHFIRAMSPTLTLCVKLIPLTSSDVERHKGESARTLTKPSPSPVRHAIPLAGHFLFFFFSFLFFSGCAIRSGFQGSLYWYAGRRFFGETHHGRIFFRIINFM